MRTFPRAFRAPLLPFVAGAAVSLLIGAAAAEPANKSKPATGPAAATEASRPAGKEPSFRELQARLDQSDRIAALYALHLALNRVADGGTFAWSKRSRALRGIIRPTSIFRNADGQICRHVIYALSLGRYRKQIELVACREAGGRWRLQPHQPPQRDERNKPIQNVFRFGLLQAPLSLDPRRHFGRMQRNMAGLGTANERTRQADGRETRPRDGSRE